MIVWMALGFILNRALRGESPEIFVEIPPYRVPYISGLAKKVWMRVSGFLREAVPFVILGVLLVNILYSLKIIDFVGLVAAPIITGVLGLPQRAVVALLVGFLRKDVAVGMLAPLGLAPHQLIVASVVLAMYFPCMATFVVMARELRPRDLALSTAIMVATSVTVGGLLNWIL
jgi:ferrous iron transport protein B